MAFKAAATDTTSNYYGTKKYLWLADYYGNGQREWRYVTTDAIGVVETAGYFTEAGFKATCQPGDKITIYHVDTLSDSRPISQDLLNISDVNEVMIVGDVGASATINVTPGLWNQSAEYSLP